MQLERWIAGGELPERLAHQARLQAHVGIAHLAFELGLGHQRGDAVDHHEVDRERAHQRVGDLERLLAGVGLRDQQLVDVDPELPGVAGVERVLGVDERAGAAGLLRLGDAVQGERGLAGGFRPVDLDDPAARQAADAEREVEAERAGRDGVDLDRALALAELHHRALAERALDLPDRRIERPLPVARVALAGLLPPPSCRKEVTSSAMSLRPCYAAGALYALARSGAKPRMNETCG